MNIFLLEITNYIKLIIIVFLIQTEKESLKHILEK